jgi:hypothetical protein
LPAGIKIRGKFSVMRRLALGRGLLRMGVKYARPRRRQSLAGSCPSVGRRPTPTELKNIPEPIRVYSLQVGVPAQAKPPKPVEPIAPVTPAAPTPQKRRFGLAPLAAALAALLIVIAGGAWWFLATNRAASVAANAPAETARFSIVVLPFANLSGDPGQDYLVDALTDELTTSLARLRGTFVIARNTAMTFKGKPVDAKAIGKDLGCATFSKARCSRAAIG